MNGMIVSRIMIIVSFFVFIIVGYIVSKKVKNAEDYYVMGRQAPTLLVAGTIVASYLSTSAFTGIFASAFNYGMGPGILNYGCILSWTVLIFILGPRIHRLKAWTIPEIMEIRYGSNRIRTVASVLLIIACASYLVSIFVGAGIALSSPLNISSKMAVLISGIVVLFFSVSGGMWGVVVTDTIMMFLFMGAVVIGFPIALSQGGVSNPREVITAINTSLPGAFKAGGYMPMFSTPFWATNGFVGFMAMMVLTSMGVGLTGAHTISRTLICKNEKTVSRSFILSQVLVVLFLVLLYATAPFIKVVAPENLTGSSAYIWMITEWFPPILAGIILAGISAAGLSTASTLLQQAGSSIGNDIYGKFFMKNVSPENKDKKTLGMSRYCMAIVGIIMMIISLMDTASDFFVLYAWAFASGIFMCWLPAILVGALSKKVSEPAAFWSTLISLTVNIIYWLFTLKYRILPHQIFVAVPTAFIVLVVVMQFRKPSEQAEAGFWKMQSKRYKKIHHYVPLEAGNE
jgi:sodium/pantothenate symporter